MQYVIVAGGRDFNDSQRMTDELNNLQDSGWLDDKFVLISGMAKGADITAYNLLKDNGFECLEFQPDWSDISVQGAVVKYNRYGAYNAVAGHMRNAAMGEEATHLVAFWDGSSRGTADMIKRMNQQNKPVTVIKY